MGPYDDVLKKKNIVQVEWAYANLAARSMRRYAQEMGTSTEPWEQQDKAEVDWAHANLNGIIGDETYNRMIGRQSYYSMSDEYVMYRTIAHEKAADYGKLRLAQFGGDIKALRAEQERLLRDLFGKVGADPLVEAPVYVDYGCNIAVGDNFYSNFNLTILDCGLVRIGNGVMCGPNVSIITAMHPLDPDRRATMEEFSHPVTIGDNVWIGANVVILPGVNIGSHCTLGAGSVVTKDVPDRSVVAGSPAKIIKTV